MERFSLADSLMQDAGWERYNFNYSGPFPPYIRIDGRWRISSPPHEICFASFIRDRGLFRTKLSAAEHLRRYRYMSVDPDAFEDVLGKDFRSPEVFPFLEWLSIGKIAFGGLPLSSETYGRIDLPLQILAVASRIYVSN